MNKKNEKVVKKTEAKETKKIESKNVSTFKKKKKIKKKYYLRHSFCLFNIQ